MIQGMLHDRPDRDPRPLPRLAERCREFVERFARSKLIADTFVSAEVIVTWKSGQGAVQSHAILVTSDDFEACARLLKSVGR